MNSWQISQLFTNPDQDFNPIETFGNRQSSHSQSKTQPSHKAFQKAQPKPQPERPSNDNDESNLDTYREETRIKLLSSYQESYLESVSQPVFTQGDQLSEGRGGRGHDYSNQLSYSESKRSEVRVEKYIVTDPNERPQSSNKQQNRPISLQDRAVRVSQLKLAIEQQHYNISIQQRLYSYLLSRIDDRGRRAPLRDHHQVVEKAIDFMDSGEEFVRAIAKLASMQAQ